MEREIMFRRTFLKLTSSFLGSTAVGKSVFADRQAKHRASISFFVAGARYHAVRAGLSEGDPVRLIAGSYRGERCYEVRVGDLRIGYAPRKLVAALDRSSSVLEGQLSSIDPKAVPWKRYQVTI
jgi:hypothetical protein